MFFALAGEAEVAILSNLSSRKTPVRIAEARPGVAPNRASQL
jgi:hypothetical protein